MKGNHLSFGKRNTAELIKKLSLENTPINKWPFKEVLIKKNPSKDIIDTIVRKLPKEIKVSYVSGGDLDSMLPGKNHQGVILLKTVSSRNTYKNFDELIQEISVNKSLILVLDRIQDPGNLGNILRTAECFGITNIIVPERDTAPINETVERIASGALHHLNLYRVTNLNQSLEKLKEVGYWIVTTSDKGSEDWSILPELEEIVLVMGNEGAGVKRLVIDNSDFQVRIPMAGNVSSLNVSVATGIAIDRIVNRFNK
ncbi:MAG: 23S rRNA (guanosine(2251)-2'-O)-methyltransferase RlmB [Leptospiraceae bacterium]|nr:23S rRNA (guanosine(2251)-2'-O)-methyltransferase RlmB [Leptospiraceae bacterium]